MFGLKELDKLVYLLGIEMKCLTQGSILLSQSKYIIELLQKSHKMHVNGCLLQ